MFYNVYIKTKAGDHQYIVGINDKQLNKLVQAYGNGEKNAILNGTQYNIHDPKSIKIYSINQEVGDNIGDIKHLMGKQRDLYYRGSWSLRLYQDNGKDISYDILKDKPWANLITENEKRIIDGLIPEYIDKARIDELVRIKTAEFDLTKLLQLCKELNSAYQQGNYYSVGAMVRAIVDHIPPIFRFTNFSEVANNYKSLGNSKSFKDSMSHLDNSMKNISNSYLHSQIRNKEVLPNSTQVDCKRDLDVLLGEVVRILK